MDHILNLAPQIQHPSLITTIFSPSSINPWLHTPPSLNPFSNTDNPQSLRLLYRCCRRHRRPTPASQAREQPRPPAPQTARTHLSSALSPSPHILVLEEESLLIEEALQEVEAADPIPPLTHCWFPCPVVDLSLRFASLTAVQTAVAVWFLGSSEGSQEKSDDAERDGSAGRRRLKRVGSVRGVKLEIRAMAREAWASERGNADDKGDGESSSRGRIGGLASGSKGSGRVQPVKGRGVSEHSNVVSDRGDATNFCYMLESFFEYLGEFSADIVPLTIQELDEAVNSGTSEVIDVKKGQLLLYPEQPLTEVEAASVLC